MHVNKLLPSNRLYEADGIKETWIAIKKMLVQQNQYSLMDLGFYELIVTFNINNLTSGSFS